MKNTIYFLAIICLIAFGSCASKTVSCPSFDTRSEYSYAGISDSQASAKKSEIPERKILYDAYIEISVKNVDSAFSKIMPLTEKYEGYMTNRSLTRTVIRVKSENFQTALREIESFGKVLSKIITGNDVTDEFSDHEIRLANAERARDRYLELLDQAENVQAALMVEKELERLNGEIERLKGKINRINHLEEYSTITISIRERKKPGVLGYIGIGLYHSVKWLFVRN